MRALFPNYTLRASPERANTQALVDVVDQAIRGHGVEVDVVRVVDHDLKPGVSNDEGDGDEWPEILGLIRNARTAGSGESWLRATRMARTT